MKNRDTYTYSISKDELLKIAENLTKDKKPSTSVTENTEVYISDCSTVPKIYGRWLFIVPSDSPDVLYYIREVKDCKYGSVTIQRTLYKFPFEELAKEIIFSDIDQKNREYIMQQYKITFKTRFFCKLVRPFYVKAIELLLQRGSDTIARYEFGVEGVPCDEIESLRGERGDYTNMNEFFSETVYIDRLQAVMDMLLDAKKIESNNTTIKRIMRCIREGSLEERLECAKQLYKILYEDH